jgi:hypothetical protein
MAIFLLEFAVTPQKRGKSNRLNGLRKRYLLVDVKSQRARVRGGPESVGEGRCTTNRVDVTSIVENAVYCGYSW